MSVEPEPKFEAPAPPSKSVWLRLHSPAGEAYTATEKSEARVVVRIVFISAPHVVYVSLLSVLSVFLSGSFGHERM